MERVCHSSKLVAGIPNRLLSPRKISRELGGREGRFSARTKNGTAQRTEFTALWCIFSRTATDEVASLLAGVI